MEQRVAIVTGGLRGLGRAMALGLAKAGHRVAAVGHIEADIPELNAAAAEQQLRDRVWPLVADSRKPEACDRSVTEIRARLGSLQSIVNVTTKLDTMNRVGTHPYGASKAALEMASEVWAKDVEGTGLTINIVNPGAGANTPGMADEMRAMSREGRAPRLVEPEEMVPPLLYVVSREADRVNGYRFDANLWDPSLPAAEAARRAGRPAGFVLH